MERLKRVVDTVIKVRLVECDPYNIVHNSNYFVWFELGRLDYAKKFGYNIKNIRDDHVVYMTLGIKCKFLKAAHFDDELIIKTMINKIPIIYAKYSFEQKLYHMKTGELLAVAHSQNVAIDRERKTVLRLEEDERYSKMEKSIKEDIEI